MRERDMTPEGTREGGGEATGKGGGVRPPAVAGMFYPGDPDILDREMRGFLAGVAGPEAGAGAGVEPLPLKALIVPHAGTVYSGPIAASAYARLRPYRHRIRRVVMLGPSHRVPVRGLAVSSADAFATPLGQVAVDRAAVRELLEAGLDGVVLSDEAHRLEHCLEVQLPFLQEVLADFAIVPIVVGDASTKEVAAVLDALWGGEETLILISSDLSHYHDYDTAKAMDAAASRAIEALDGAQLADEQACGRIPIKGLLAVAARRGLRAETVDLRNSGDTAGTRDSVVGYGAYVFTTA